ncbi:MAG: hypothetical protein F8N37_22785 [Telmatospirillum sp.]|nr:hypothetical protein [Telmatospirillum sp.]
MNLLVVVMVIGVSREREEGMGDTGRRPPEPACVGAAPRATRRTGPTPFRLSRALAVAVACLPLLSCSEPEVLTRPASGPTMPPWDHVPVAACLDRAVPLPDAGDKEGGDLGW